MSQVRSARANGALLQRRRRCRVLGHGRRQQITGIGEGTIACRHGQVTYCWLYQFAE